MFCVLTRAAGKSRSSKLTVAYSSFLKEREIVQIWTCIQSRIQYPTPFVHLLFHRSCLKYFIRMNSLNLKAQSYAIGAVVSPILLKSQVSFPRSQGSWVWSWVLRSHTPWVPLPPFEHKATQKGSTWQACVYNYHRPCENEVGKNPC